MATSVIRERPEEFSRLREIERESERHLDQASAVPAAEDPAVRFADAEIVGDPGPGLAAIRVHESAFGEDDFGPRTAMWKELPGLPPDHGPGAHGPR